MRRHRIYEDELMPVFEALSTYLSFNCLNEPDEMVPLPEILSLFRLWWRIKEGRQGKPDYPKNITYGTIKEYLSTKSSISSGGPPEQILTPFALGKIQEA